MSEAARRARPTDLEAIESLLTAAAEAIVGERGGSTYLVAEGAALEPVADLLDDPDAVVVVGTYDDVVFGVASMRFVELADRRLVGRIGRLVVDAEARKAGIGEAIMNQLLEACAERGCVAVESVALPGDRHTKNFFESFGLKARLLVVARDLET